MSKKITLLEEKGYRVIMHHDRNVCSLEKEDGKDQRGDTRWRDRYIFESDQIEPPGALQPEGDGCLYPSHVFTYLCEELDKAKSTIKNLREELEKTTLENKSPIEKEDGKGLAASLVD